MAHIHLVASGLVVSLIGNAFCLVLAYLDSFVQNARLGKLKYLNKCTHQLESYSSAPPYKNTYFLQTIIITKRIKAKIPASGMLSLGADSMSWPGGP